MESLSHSKLLAYRDDDGQIRSVQSLDDWQKRRLSILESMQVVMGKLPGEEKRCRLEVHIEDEVDCGSYIRKQLTYSSEPGSRVPAYLLVPKALLQKQRRAPAILCLHQTTPLGPKVVVGLADHPQDEYGVELAERGYVIFAPCYPLLGDYQPNWRALGYQSGTMKAIWDNIRGLDFLESLSYVQSGRFGAMGHSLGGHNSVFTAALDCRIQVIVSSCGLDSFIDYKNGDIRGWTSDRYMPRLLDYPLNQLPFDFHEVIGVLAPRPCFISAPLDDENFKWRSVDAVGLAAMEVYHLYKTPQNLLIKHPDCAHFFPSASREMAYEFIHQHLL